MPGGHGHENKEERGHCGKVRKYPHITCGQTMLDGMGRFREAAGEGVGGYLPFCCRLTRDRVLAGVSPLGKTRMDPTGKKEMRMSGIAW